MPDYLNRIYNLQPDNMRFVYYTSAEVAYNILTDQKMWFRNVTTMNDFSEINYGIDIINNALEQDVGTDLENAVEEIFPGAYQNVLEFTSKWINDWKYETYIACVSIHDESEDEDGRLSMWRAYGNTALVKKIHL